MQRLQRPAHAREHALPALASRRLKFLRFWPVPHCEALGRQYRTWNRRRAGLTAVRHILLLRVGSIGGSGRKLTHPLARSLHGKPVVLRHVHHRRL
jgi:hypothetical protein